jgi:ABC-type antimicrobial peptide transport system permease subunit
MFAQFASIFGLIGLLLACVGLHGTMSYLVTRRTSEIGIRMALGAEQREVLWMTLRESIVLLVIGVAVGLTLMFSAQKFIASELFGVSATDPAVLGAAIAILAAVALTAAYLPARRASKVDAMVALRYE